MNGESHIDGILLGYLPGTGTCEVKLYNGGVELYPFTPKLNLMTIANPAIYHDLINKQVRLIMDREIWLIDRIQSNEVEEKN